MTHELACPGCGRGLEVPELPAGARIRCPACSHVFACGEDRRGANASTSAVVAGPGGAPSPASSRIPSLALGPTPGAPAEGNAPASPSSHEPSRTTADVPAATVVRENRWQLRTPEGLVFGPVDRSQLDQWVREGRVTADCQLRDEEADAWRTADSIYPALIERAPPGVADPRLHYAVATPSPLGNVPQGGNGEAVERVLLRPHRGPLILTLAIVGLLVQCPIFSILAWVMGSSDLEEILVGRMNPEGLKATRAGRMLGMIMSLFWIIMAVILVSVFVLVLAVR